MTSQQQPLDLYRPVNLQGEIPLQWVDLLVRGDYVWLTKQNMLAVVQWAWLLDGYDNFGRIGLQLLHRRANGWHSGENQNWIVDARGRGINLSQCLSPATTVADAAWFERQPARRANYVQQEVAGLSRRIAQLERRLAWLISEAPVDSPPLPLRSIVLDRPVQAE